MYRFDCGMFYFKRPAASLGRHAAVLTGSEGAQGTGNMNMREVSKILSHSFSFIYFIYIHLLHSQNMSQFLLLFFVG